MRSKTYLLPLVALVAILGMGEVIAQETETTQVTLNHTTQRYLEKDGVKVSALDRDKYFTFHEDRRATADSELSSFMSTYGVNYGRSIGSGPLGNAYSNAGSVANLYPDLGDGVVTTTTTRQTFKYILADHSGYGYLNGETNVETAAEWAVKYFSDLYTVSTTKEDAIPEFFEPLNEPVVEATSVGKMTDPIVDQKDMIDIMFNYYNKVGQLVHNTPALANMKVIGYAAAYPEYQLNDFDRWSWTMGRFIDIAGDNMDGISIHMYDGASSSTGLKQLRSGGNSEALLDIIEAYSYKVCGVAKPIVLSEYGGSDGSSSLDTTNTSPGSNPWCEYYSDYTVGPIHHLLHNILERQDNLLFSVMFISGKATWYLNSYAWPYSAVLFRPSNPADYKGDSEWLYTQKLRIYELWRDVKGDRLDIKSDNPDVQVQAFRDGQMLYISLSNISDYSQTVTLQHKLSEVSSVVRRKLNTYYQAYVTTGGEGIVYEESTQPGLASDYTLAPNEGNVFVITLNDTPTYTNEITRKKYYQNTWLESASGSKSYTFNGVGLESGDGRALLRMTLSKTSISSTSDVMNMLPNAIEVNGNEVSVPTNWRGDDQVGRTTFLGMIDVPFDISYLNSGTNSVKITFPTQSSVFIPTVILEVESYKNAAPTSIIDNGDFEGDDLSTWSPWSRLGRVAIDSDNGYDGRALKIDGAAGVMQDLNLEAGKNYYISLCAKSLNGAEVAITLSDGQGTEAESVIDSDTYEFYETSFTPKSSSSQLTISVESGTAWIDNIAIIEIE